LREPGRRARQAWRAPRLKDVVLRALTWGSWAALLVAQFFILYCVLNPAYGAEAVTLPVSDLGLKRGCVAGLLAAAAALVVVAEKRRRRQ
jgi:hypothetical protein